MKRTTGHLKFNIGKNGYNENIILTLQNAFKERENVKVIVLKSAGHTKENVNEIADKIVAKLGKNYTYKVMGYTIFLKRWRRFTKNAKNKAR
jgi:RNA-binding protein YhbY